MRHAAALALAAVLSWAPASAQEPPSRHPITTHLVQEARDREADGDLEAAESLYRQVLRLEPDWLQARLGLGRLLEDRGDLAGAAEVYGAARYDVDALSALWRVQVAQQDWVSAVRTAQRLRGYDDQSTDPIRQEAHATAPMDDQRAAALYRDYLRAHDATRDPADGADTLAVVARSLADAQGPGAGLAFLDEAERSWPVLGAEAAVEHVRDRLAIEDEARRLALAAHRPLTDAQRVVLARARAARADGRLLDARALLDDLVADNPRNAEVWGVLADVAASQDDVAAADLALQTAERLAPLDPEYPARLGDLLFEEYGGRQDVAAAAAYDRALRLNPTRAELWYRKGLAEQRLEQWEAAEESLLRYAELDRAAPLRDHALRAARGMHRERPIASGPQGAGGCPPSVSDDACRAFHVATVLHKKGRAADALAELELVREAAPAWVQPINLEASVLMDAGDYPAAVRKYEESLRLDPHQELPYKLLYDLLRQVDAEAARTIVQRAEANGVGVSHYLLAVEAWEEWDPVGARRELDAYFAADTSGRYHAEARALQRRVDRLFRGWWAGVGVTGVLLFVGVPGVWARRRSGVGVEDLLRRAPTAYREVARIGSALRHEVLKHNTTLLPVVADALDRDDPAPAWWAADKLFGDRGAVARFRLYVHELEVVGRMHGVRLNLRHRDPTFGPLIAAFDQLSRLERELTLGRGPGLADRLRRVSEALNDQGYRALGVLLRRVCLLRVDEGVFFAAWDRVVGEPSFRDAALPELDVDLPRVPVLVRIYRGDLEDILANVLRNALTATLETAPSPGRVGVRVDSETDWITGLERLEIRVADHAPAKITTALIRGRYIERGLGLTVDLISRNGGSIHVEEEPGWSKAVVIRLPRAEAGSLEER